MISWKEEKKQHTFFNRPHQLLESEHSHSSPNAFLVVHCCCTKRSRTATRHLTDFWCQTACNIHRETVDGSEIRRSPVEVGSLSHYLQSFRHPRWFFGISSINRRMDYGCPASPGKNTCFFQDDPCKWFPINKWAKFGLWISCGMYI